MAAAVEAAPMRREWDDVFAMPPVVSERSSLRSFRVRYLLLLYVKSGPVCAGWNGRKAQRAATGQMTVSFAANRMVIP